VDNLEPIKARDTQVRFGHAVRARRRQLGLSQEALAAVANIHRTYIGSVERGERNVALNNIVALSKALQTTPSALLEGVE